MQTINIKTYIECKGELQELDKIEFSENLIEYLTEMFKDIKTDEQIEAVEITVKENGVIKETGDIDDFQHSNINVKEYINELIEESESKKPENKILKQHDNLINWLNTK